MTDLDIQKLVLIDWHDSFLECIAVPGSCAEVQLGGVSVFREVTRDELYLVEQGRAVLKLHGVTFGDETLREYGESLDQAEIADSRWVVDCELGQDIDANDIQALMRGVGRGKLVLTMNDGGSVGTEFEFAVLELIEPFSRCEEWRGPLSS